MRTRLLPVVVAFALVAVTATQASAAGPMAAPSPGPSASGTPSPPPGTSGTKPKHINTKSINQAQREAAAKRAQAKGLATLEPTADNLATAAMAVPGSAPHYFGPYANYANSPLHLADALVEISGGGGTGAAATASVDANGSLTGITLTSGGSGYTTAPDVKITSLAGQGYGATATATVDASGAVTGITLATPGWGYLTPGIKKFVDGLAGVGKDNANNLGQYIPQAVPDTTTYPGSDYYEIALVEYQEKMHSDLPPTRLRGYVQLSTAKVPGDHVALTSPDGTPITLPDGSQAYGADKPHYLGPLIEATKDRPVRVLFRNLLPTGQGGDLFLPVDTTVMGAGMGPNMNGMADPDPQHPMCGEQPKPMGCYTDNRASLHLHGGITPWISDGTPHQWITPAGENTPYPKGVSVQNVPDMPDPGPGAQTFFYTNQQSARLMWYHDHAWGITRLNVYAGMAAPYVITDATEKKLVSDGVLPGPADTLPLTIQDKTFVPSQNQLAVQDPTWDQQRWGTEGNLWVPHVYMPAQNPGDSSGVNQFGRWAYGPWFWPPTTGIDYPPMANPYYDPNCDPDVATWCEPEQVPATPYNSMGMEAFNDTPLVNGTAYPTVTLDPKAYRLRFLNAANDRFFNLSLYQADSSGTEVALNAAEVAAAKDDPSVFPTPDTTRSPAGPDWIQVGSEGGFLPTPAVIPAHPITWVTDPTVFNAGNVDKHSLLMGPAERTDVVVDFSRYAGKTLILYNDAPAAFPARDPRYDYYTDNADLASTGGAPTTVAGYGPNTRTVMQIKIAATAPAPAFDVAKLNAAFAHHADGSGVFESGQKPIIVGQGAYNTALGTAFKSSSPKGKGDGLVRIEDNDLTFNTLSGNTLTANLEPKAIQDEMGEAWEKSYGRMSGSMGLEAPNGSALTQNFVLYPYVNPATEILDGVTDASPITTMSDGTQIWKITHNGVDTHPVHFHLFDVQLINRVGWDGIIRKPDPNELGWKDTVRVSPLEDTIVAIRPVLPKIPFGIPDSVRPLNPMMPLGSTAMFNSVDANGQALTPPITNQMVNFGWEYVWHCHILSHEEMDMMRPISVKTPRQKPAAPVATYTRDAGGAVTLTWTDGTPATPTDQSTWGDPANEIGFKIMRATVTRGRVGAYTQVGSALANVTTFTDPTAAAGSTYRYRIEAWNVAGAAPSRAILVGPTGVSAPVAPTGLALSLMTGPKVNVVWHDNASNETGFDIERATDAAGPFQLVGNRDARSGTGRATWVDGSVVAGTTYYYRVRAINGGGQSAWTDPVAVTPPTLPAAPSGLTATVTPGRRSAVQLAWTDNAGNESAFEVQRSTSSAFTRPSTYTLPGADIVTWSQTGLVSGRTYYYRVRAVNSTGPSAWSNTATATG